MTYCVLGVLMVAPEHSFLQHLVWLRKRIAVGGFEVKGALACSASLGPGQVGGWDEMMMGLGWAGDCF